MRYLASMFLLGCLCCVPVHSSVEVHVFDTAKQEALYHDLINTLRCLVCQNQNLADSNATLAVDLRQRTYDMIMAGQNRAQIIDFMVSRYGDFVLYQPPFKTITWLLWLGPILFLLVGFWVLWRVLRQQQTLPEGDDHDECEGMKHG